jgi:septation ring formation regulator EzrA
MIQLFNKNGQVQMPTAEELATLTPADRERLDVVRVAYDAMKAKEAERQAAGENVQRLVEKLSKAETLLSKFPAPSFADLVRASSTFAQQTMSSRRA